MKNLPLQPAATTPISGRSTRIKQATMAPANSVQVFGKWVDIYDLGDCFGSRVLMWSDGGRYGCGCWSRLRSNCPFGSSETVSTHWTLDRSWRRPRRVYTTYDCCQIGIHANFFLLPPGKRQQPLLPSPSKAVGLSRSMDNQLRTLSLKFFAWRFSSLFWLLDKINSPTWTSESGWRVEVSPHKSTLSEPPSPSRLLHITQSTWTRAQRMSWERLWLTTTELFWFPILVVVNPRSMVDAVPVPASKSLTVRLNNIKRRKVTNTYVASAQVHRFIASGIAPIFCGLLTISWLESLPICVCRSDDGATND